MKKRRPKFSKADKRQIARLMRDYQVDQNEAARMFVQRGF